MGEDGQKKATMDRILGIIIPSCLVQWLLCETTGLAWGNERFGGGVRWARIEGNASRSWSFVLCRVRTTLRGSSPDRTRTKVWTDTAVSVG